MNDGSAAGGVTSYVIERGDVSYPVNELIDRRATLFHESLSVALVIGTFAAVPYVHLHLESRRRLYPDVPLLVHDDGSPKTSELKELCAAYGAEFETNATRLPPCKGDLTAMAGGLRWAHERKAGLLVKMSRRFLPRIRWVDDLVSLAKESQYATYNAWTTSFNFGFRTECIAFAVEEWFAFGLVNDIAAAIIAPGTPFVEGFIHQLARRAAERNCQAAEEYDQRVGPRPSDRNGYAVWPFMGFDRKARTLDYLWHDSAEPSDYAAQACSWGLPYGEQDFADPNMGYGAVPAN